jgi:hypothetical protein
VRIEAEKPKALTEQTKHGGVPSMNFTQIKNPNNSISKTIKTKKQKIATESDRKK